MISMSAQRKNFIVVVSDLNKCNCEDIKTTLPLLVQYGFSYFAIIHDKDMDNNGVLKRKHLHIVLIATTIKRAKQVLHLICDLFLTNEENIQIMECLDIVSSIQYLTHKNDQNKYRYMCEDIMTNDYDTMINLYESNNSKVVVTTKLLFDLCDSGMTLREIIGFIGVNNYLAYRLVIKDIKESITYEIQRKNTGK